MLRNGTGDQLYVFICGSQCQIIECEIKDDLILAGHEKPPIKNQPGDFLKQADVEGKGIAEGAYSGI